MEITHCCVQTERPYSRCCRYRRTWWVVCPPLDSMTLEVIRQLPTPTSADTSVPS